MSHFINNFLRINLFLHFFWFCIFRSSTWIDAERYCKSQGGYLLPNIMESDTMIIYNLITYHLLDIGWKAVGELIYTGFHSGTQVATMTVYLIILEFLNQSQLPTHLTNFYFMKFCKRYFLVIM